MKCCNQNNKFKMSSAKDAEDEELQVEVEVLGDHVRSCSTANGHNNRMDTSGRGEVS